MRRPGDGVENAAPTVDDVSSATTGIAGFQSTGLE